MIYEHRHLIIYANLLYTFAGIVLMNTRAM